MDFEFKLFLNESKSITWNPDTAQNGHLMITGGSGAGKTRLSKELMEYLYKRGKNIHVIDVQNTLGMTTVPERVFNFEARNSPYSINPFEFTLDEKAGGPNVQVDDIMSMFSKTFMRRLKSAPNMSAVLRRLIADTYRRSGIIDEDITTWGFGMHRKEQNDRLPIIADMKELVDYILNYVSAGYGAKFGSIIAKNGKLLNQWQEQTTRLNEEMRKLEEVADRDEALSNKERERLQLEIADLKSKITSNFDGLVAHFKEYLEFSFLGGDVPAYEALLEEGESSYSWLDFKYYSDKDRLNSIKTIKTYIETLNNSGVFGRVTPSPSFSEINRYNLASIKDEAQLFCADILTSKIFRMLYLRGEYKSLPEGNLAYTTRRPGTKTDTAIVVDEMQTLLPNTVSEAKNKNLLYNRMISQIRNFGGMIMALSQTPDNFPELFHTNIATKIILKTEANDIAKVRKSANIKDVNLFKHLEHRNKDGDFDVGLMRDRVGDWHSIRLPWYTD